MTTTVNALRLRKVMGRDEWLVPEPFGPDGWRMFSRDGSSSVIATTCDFEDGEWTHASIARQTMPTYEDLCQLHQAVWGDGYAHQVFVPRDHHVNIHEHALHLWGRADGARVLPDFGFLGRI
jgi:hypothetical protein